MTTSDNKKKNESAEGKKDAKEDLLEEIKKEEKEDASAYYAQSKEETPDMKGEFEKPVPEVEKAREDMNLFRALGFLGFGLAVFAIIFIFFFIRDLDHRVGGMDSTVNKLEDSIGPLKTGIEDSVQSVKEVQESLAVVTATVAGLKGKLSDYEKSMAIMQLKRALVMVQGISMGSQSGVQSKSSEVAASIQSLLSELVEKPGNSASSVGEIRVQEAEEPAAEEAAEEGLAAELEETEEPAAEDAGELSESSEEEMSGGGHASEEQGEAAGMVELPTVEELLQE